MDEPEEIIFQTFNLKAETYRATYAWHPREAVKERQRFDRLVIEGIVVVDTKQGGAPAPFFIPAGEMERIWRATEGKDPRWHVAARYFVWDEGDGTPNDSWWTRLIWRLDWTRITCGHVRRAIRR
jgi:hypothetical protein